MKVIISFEKKNLYFFLFGIGVIILFGFVMAYNSVYGGGYPSVLGHSADELKVNISGNYKTLQEAIDNQDLSAWTKSGNDILYNNGNVGIGAGSPGSNLHIAPATGDAILQLTNPAGSVQGWISRYTNRLHIASNDLIQFGTGGQVDADVTIDSVGNVGIGTDIPGVKLDVAGDVRANQFLANNVRANQFCIGANCISSWPSGGGGNGGGGDNLGNHIASQDLNMVGRNIVNTGNIEMAGGTLKLAASNSPPYACDGSKLGQVYFDTGICWGGGSCPYGVIQVPCACVEWRTGTADYRWATLFDPELLCD